jgi:AcrR family transcriptional regulator
VIECVAANGYTATSVADILAHAGISRATFYTLFTDKEDCFLAAYARSAGELEHALAAALQCCDADAHAGATTDASATAPATRLQALIHTWLVALTDRPATAKALLVDIQAAGPAANAFRQAALERFIAQALEVLGPPLPIAGNTAHETTVGHADQAFLVRVMMHGALSMATALIVTGRHAELPDLEAPLTGLFRSLVHAPTA